MDTVGKGKRGRGKGQLEQDEPFALYDECGNVIPCTKIADFGDHRFYYNEVDEDDHPIISLRDLAMITMLQQWGCCLTP